MTGGTRLGMQIARPKCAAVKGSTAFSMAPSRTCKCQSSGFLRVMRSAISLPGGYEGLVPLPDGCSGGAEGFRNRIVDHRAGEIGDASEASLVAPLRQLVDDRHQRR